jgi:hypothetical protein
MRSLPPDFARDLEAHRVDLRASPLPERPRGPGLAAMFLLLFVILSLLFYRVYLPGHTLFSNDGPLARLMSRSHKLPERFTGDWQDLNSVGYREPGAMPDISFGLQFLLKPVGFSKFYAIVSLTILGLGAWFFFRRSGLSPPACILGGLAAVLNSSFFSDACWGVAGHAIAIGMIFLALALLVDTSPSRRWLRVILAGFAVGMAVTEGADLGAIFSLYVAAFVLYVAWTAAGPRAKNLAAGTGRVALIAVCAGIVSAQAVSELVATNVIDVTTPLGLSRTPVERWDWATQWSLPKRETLSLVVPGLFGYRVDTPDGGNYWGTIGRDANWLRYDQSGGTTPRPPAGVFTRYTGGGFYAGVTAVLVTLWAALQALRRKDSVFSLPERKRLWFWLAAGITALLIAYGRYAPFYRIIYDLPGFSFIRNPVKFLDIVNFAIVILFAFGVDGLWRHYLRPAGSRAPSPPAGRIKWRTATGAFEKKWIYGCCLVLAGSLAAWVFYAVNRNSLEDYLYSVQFTEAIAPVITAFSIRQVGWFVLFFVLAAGLMLLIFSGRFAGGRARWAAILLGVVLVADLGRANLPWINFWDYQAKYASNPIVDSFRAKPWEHRVAMFPIRPPPRLAAFERLYRLVWLQQLFPYYNVQSLDLVQMSRMPDDLAEFNATFKPASLSDMPRVARQWQLTNTRYLLGAAVMQDMLGQGEDSSNRWLRIVSRFSVVPKTNGVVNAQMDQMTAVPDTNGDYAVFEFNDALPRAGLYTRWQINSNDQDLLNQLADLSFDPRRTVLVAGGVPPPPADADTNQDAGAVEITSYAPKDVVLKSSARPSTVLLLNDRFDPNWTATVDGTRRPVLRCNYLMRGVYLEPGAHTIEFKYQPPYHALYLSLAALGVGLVLAGFLVFSERRAPVVLPTPVASPRPQLAPNPKPPASKATPPSPAPARSKRSAKARR